jgi:hypothetical protein
LMSRERNTRRLGPGASCSGRGRTGAREEVEGAREQIIEGDNSRKEKIGGKYIAHYSDIMIPPWGGSGSQQL